MTQLSTDYFPDYFNNKKEDQQKKLSDLIPKKSSQLCANLNKDRDCKNNCLTYCIAGFKFWK